MHDSTTGQVAPAQASILLDAEAFYTSQLTGSWVPAYLRKRGITAAATGEWHIGYAPCGWTALTDHLRRLGYPTASGMFPQLSAQEWRDVMIEAYACCACEAELAALTRFDPVKAVEDASIEQLRRAREAAAGLAGFGALLLLYGLLMPDTPGLTALRARISELGIGPMLINLTRQAIQPQRTAFTIATCLDPAHQALYKSLSETSCRGDPSRQTMRYRSPNTSGLTEALHPGTGHSIVNDLDVQVRGPPRCALTG